MLEDEILDMWNNGYSKKKIAEIYKKRHNQHVKIIRMDMKNRNKGKYLSSYESLNYIENIIYRYIKEKENSV